MMQYCCDSCGSIIEPIGVKGWDIGIEFHDLGISYTVVQSGRNELTYLATGHQQHFCRTCWNGLTDALKQVMAVWINEKES
jgi:hypothetical protein